MTTNIGQGGGTVDTSGTTSGVIDTGIACPLQAGVAFQLMVRMEDKASFKTGGAVYFIQVQNPSGTPAIVTSPSIIPLLGNVDAALVGVTVTPSISGTTGNVIVTVTGLTGGNIRWWVYTGHVFRTDLN